MPRKECNKHILIVTGLSGAGMSSSLKHLEDFGYEVFDNFPVRMVDPLLKAPESKERPVAIGLDTRTRGFRPDAVLTLAKKHSACLLFLRADENVLQKRFTETRRRHPLAQDRPAIAGIQQEIDLLASLQDEADTLLDTTHLSIHDLRDRLAGHYKSEDSHKLTTTIMSFGFKHGLPREADIVMDVRFLKNPNWVEDLKPLTGQDKAVGEYIQKDEGYEVFTENFKAMLEPLIPLYIKEGKSYLTIAIGCTGGRHRSVFLSETLKKWLETLATDCSIKHRDLPVQSNMTDHHH